MLIVTLAMESFLALVFISTSLIHCQAITVRDDDSIYDAAPKSYTYPEDSDLAKSEIRYGPEEYYKQLRRADVREYQYPPDESQELNYQLQPRQEIENYQKRREPQSRRTITKKPIVEQYLKEVTPTTKTAYIQRPGNDLRLRGQPRDRLVKQQAEELQRGILNQQSVQYVLQSDLQQKSQSSPQVQYVLRDQKSPQLQQHEEPQAEGLTAYQNALLAHQKVLETESQDATSRSSIFVMHSIPKKPVRKIVKPAPTDEIEQYARIQRLQQKPASVYEQPEPAQIRYPAKFEAETEDTNYQASTEAPRYQNEKILEYQRLRQQIQDLAQYQQVSTEDPLYQQQLAGYQQVLADNQGKIPRLNSEEVLEYQPQRPRQQIPVQYQPVYLKKGGPKYLPEPKSLRYQPQIQDQSEEKYQVVNITPQGPGALISYEAALAKLQQSEKLVKTRQPRPRPQPQVSYQQQEQDTKPLSYAVPNGGQETNSPEQEYVRIGETDKYRSNGNAAAVVYRQSQQNPNVRYYRRPAISYPQYQ